MPVDSEAIVRSGDSSISKICRLSFLKVLIVTELHTCICRIIKYLNVRVNYERVYQYCVFQSKQHTKLEDRTEEAARVKPNRSFLFVRKRLKNEEKENL